MNKEKEKPIITAEQIRAGRGLLGWTIKELSVASTVNVATIGYAETHEDAVTDKSLQRIKNAFTAEGVKFLPHNGLDLSGRKD